MRRRVHEMKRRVVCARVLRLGLGVLLVGAAGAARAAAGQGRLVYGVTNAFNDRVYDGAAVAAATTAVVAGNPVASRVVASPNQDEYIAAYLVGSQLYVVRWRCGALTSEWNVAVGTGTYGRPFDIAYEQASGAAVVVYARTATTNGLAYRTFDPTTATWSAEATTNLDLNGATADPAYRWVKLVARDGSDALALGASDGANLYVRTWDGTTWAATDPTTALNAAALANAGTAGDSESFDLAYENTAGDLLVVWGLNATSSGFVWYRTRSAAAAWGTAATASTTFTSKANVIDLASEPGTNRVLFASVGGTTGAAGVLKVGVWSGTAWGTTSVTLDTSAATVTAGYRTVGAGWISGTASMGVVVYADSAGAGVDFARLSGTTWAVQTDQLAGMGTKRQIELVMDPFNAGRVIALFADSAGALWAKAATASGTTITWANADGGASLGTVSTTTRPAFSFAYDDADARLTVGDGTNPGNGTLGPAQTGMVDAFTLATRAGSAVLSSATVSLAPGSEVGIGLVEVTNDAGTTVYGSATPTSATVTVPLSTNTLTATATSTQYRVRLTARAATAMPPPPGAVYTATGTVTSVTSALCSAVVYGDGSSASVAIDNSSPADATFGGVTAGSASVALAWTNPTDTDLAGLLILRDELPVGDVPLEGSSPPVNTSVGLSTVVYDGAVATSFTDTSVTSGIDYYYRIFAFDGFRNYAVGTSTDATTGPWRASIKTVVGTGADPASVARIPGDAPTLVDAFTLQTNSAGATDSVTAVTVSFTAGSEAGVSAVAITNATGATTYGSAGVTSPVVTVPLSTSLPVTSSVSPSYMVQVSIKPATAMPYPPGALYAVTAAVTGITSTLPGSYTDTTSGTVTIDNLSPGDAALTTVTPGNAQMTLAWINPADVDFSSVVLVRDTNPVATSPTEGVAYVAGAAIGTGVVRYTGAASTFNDTPLTNGTTYHYAIFARDGAGNYALGSASGPVTPVSTGVTVEAPTATASGCGQVTVYAPFSGDGNGNSTATVNRCTAATCATTTAVCTGLTGASPRVCVDTSAPQGASLWYQVVFTDADGVTGSPQTTAQVTTTTGCGTAAGTATAIVSSCSAITATAPFTGDPDLDGSVRVEYNTSNAWTGAQLTGCAAVTGSSPRVCLVSGLAASTTYYVRVTYTDPDGVTGTTPQVLAGTYATPACAGSGAPPMILLVSPGRDTTVGGVETFKVQVYDPDGVSTASILWGLDGAAPTSAVTRNTNYDCNLEGQTTCGIYELTVNTTGLANGAHYVTIRATDSAGTPSVAQVAFPFDVNNAGTKPAGTGKLLRRTGGGQLCVDCHAMPTHSSQATSSRYGSWAIDCQTCHTPHRTRNLHLVRESISTPSSGVKAVDFRTESGVAQYSYATPLASGNGVNVCEVCHTKTRNTDGTARARNSSSTDWAAKHYTTNCVACHNHALGFAAGESKGGASCGGCHNAIWQGMTGAVAKTSKHSLGAVLGTNDAFTDTNVTWGSPLSANVAASRSCVNMCHDDHVHNVPPGTTHDYDVYADATSQASRAATSRTATDKARTDFDAAQANGGMCVSCHRNPVTAGAPAVTLATFNASAHDYTTNAFGTWTYTLHDNSTFARNCTKCHSDPGDARPNATATPFGGVHYSSQPRLLAGSTNPAGAPATYICYACHGNGTTGANLSGKVIVTDAVKTPVKHNVNADTLHSSTNEATVAYAAAGNVFRTSRHVNCIDCHEPHAAASPVHTYATTATATRNAVTPPLTGVSGVAVTYTGLASWAAPGASNYTWIPATTGASYEYQICLKCHSSFAWGTGTPPNGVSPNGTSTAPVETDLALELNPANRSGHPIVVGLNSYTYATYAGNSGVVAPRALPAANMKAPWTAVGTQTMMCNDCHNTDAASTAAQGPHGSAVQFMLRGPLTAWPNVTLANFATSFCANCHNNFGGLHTRGDHTSEYCYACHVVVPHGSKMSRLMGDRDTMPARYAYNGVLTNMQIQSFTKAVQSGTGAYVKGSCQAACAGDHSGTATENW